MTAVPRGQALLSSGARQCVSKEHDDDHDDDDE